MLTPGVVEFFSVSCSRDNFERLFGGDLLRPMLVWFSAMENTEVEPFYLLIIKIKKFFLKL
jgi:hypothetical protein